jgi:colicin import membrane protein
VEGNLDYVPATKVSPHHNIKASPDVKQVSPRYVIAKQIENEKRLKEIEEEKQKSQQEELLR